ncbi:MAG: patatin-like phospholipase family protein [Pseudolabrys sp.]
MRIGYGRFGFGLVGLTIALMLGGCATIHNLPLNVPTSNPFGPTPADAAGSVTSGGDAIGLAFSGGGTRAAAFSYGVLKALARTPSPARDHRDLLEHVGMVTGVSGGSVTAAYYGLRGRAALSDFRQRFLTQDLMSQLDTNVDLINIGRALSGGINTDTRLRDWLNRHLFGGATFGDLLARKRPWVLINATDVYSRTPFLFTPQTFAAFCSDVQKYPLAAAVAASAAVPGAFAPVVIKTYPGQCSTPLPSWVTRALREPDASPLLSAYATALARDHTGAVKYIKLFDGGLVDNYGLSGLTIARESVQKPYAPLRPQEAVNMRRLLFLVVDAGRGPEGRWAQTLEGPSGAQLISAVTDAAIGANTQSSYTAFQATMKDWQDQLVRWRCGLKPAQVARLRRGHHSPWRCRDVKIIVGRIAFDQLGSVRARQLNAIPTTFSLPAQSVDALTQAAGDALRINPAYKEFLKEM